MDVPRNQRAECLKCGGDVILARTSRKSKGEWVTVLLDADEDREGDSPGTQWVLSMAGGTYCAGQPATKSQKAAMVAAGYAFHQEHTKACAKRCAQSKRLQGRR